MFETEPLGNKSLNDILRDELEYFDATLQYSKKFLKQVDTLPVAVLAKMVNYRQQWIDKIQELEQLRNTLNEEENEDSKTYLKEISKTAKKLVKIDERIYEHLQQRKIKIVNERSNIISETQYTKKQGASGEGKSQNILNIIQE